MKLSYFYYKTALKHKQTPVSIVLYVRLFRFAT